MYNTMKKFCDEGTYVAVYGNLSDTSKFMFGQLLCVNEDRFAMLLISPNGNYDGIVVDDIDDIFRIDSHGHYHEKMAKLSGLCIESLKIPCIDPSCIDLSILSFAKETRSLVSIELRDSGIVDVVGFIENVADEVCQIHVVDEYGYDDGCTFVDMSSISQIALGSEDEQRIMKLYCANNQYTNKCSDWDA